MVRNRHGEQAIRQDSIRLYHNGTRYFKNALAFCSQTLSYNSSQWEGGGIAQWNQQCAHHSENPDHDINVSVYFVKSYTTLHCKKDEYKLKEATVVPF